MIEVENVTKLYGEVRAVDGVSFRIGKGEVVGLLGPNGAGKTTMMRILTGYHLPSSGRARINDYDIYADSVAVRRSVGYLPENAPVYDELTVGEYLEFIAGARAIPRPERAERIEEASRTCGLGSVMEQTISTLSKGYRQRVGVAQAIMHSPEILILDEPTTGLDPNQIKDMRRLLKELGNTKTVILSTHVLGEVEAVCGRVLIMNKGKIVAEGAPDVIAGKLKGKPRFRLEMRAAELGKADLLAAKFVAEVVSLSRGEKGHYTAELITTDERNSGELLFDWAVERGYKIISMVPVGMSLEEIFSQLTREAGE